MISLESDKAYRLLPVSSPLADDGGSAGDGKLYFHIKFTDSSFKAVEEHYARSMLPAGSKKSSSLYIHFNETGDLGYFDVPTSADSKVSASSSTNSGNVRRFQFSLAPAVVDGGSASFECFQQKKTNDNLPAFGPFYKRITVKAQEDVFEATRDRMVAEVEKSEKNKAREITTNSGALKSRRGNNSANAAVARMNYAGASTAGNKATDATLLCDAAANAKRRAAERIASINKEHHQDSAKPSSGGSKSPQHSLRDRVLYTLAVRPLSESQLITHLRLSHRDQLDLSAVLKQLCHSPGNSQGNTVYQLRREAFADVKLEHPLVGTHEERQAIKRNMANSSSNKPQRPPPSSSEHAIAKQRRLDDNTATNHRHSLPARSATAGGCVAPISSKTRPAAPGRMSNGLARSKQQQSSMPLSVSPSKDSLDSNTGNDNGRNSSSSSRASNTFNQPVVSGSSASCSPEPQNANSSSTSAPSPIVISSREQRTAMKSDFMAKYDEYRKLHESLSEKTAFFRDMRPELEKLRQGSDEYRRVEESIREAYSRLQDDPAYTAAKRKLDDLHATLARIKRAIEDYDGANAASMGAPGASSSPAVTSMG